MTTIKDIRNEMERKIENGVKIYVTSEMEKWNEKEMAEGRLDSLDDIEFIESAAEEASFMIGDFQDIKYKIIEWSERMYSESHDFSCVNDYIDWGYITDIVDELL